MGTEVWSFVSIIAIPALAAIVGWVWRLDGRVYEIQKELLSRDEFVTSMNKLRDEIHDLRKAVLGGHT